MGRVRPDFLPPNAIASYGVFLGKWFLVSVSKGHTALNSLLYSGFKVSCKLRFLFSAAYLQKIDEKFNWPANWKLLALARVCVGEYQGLCWVWRYMLVIPALHR